MRTVNSRDIKKGATAAVAVEEEEERPQQKKHLIAESLNSMPFDKHFIIQIEMHKNKDKNWSLAFLPRPLSSRNAEGVVDQLTQRF